MGGIFGIEYLSSFVVRNIPIYRHCNFSCSNVILKEFATPKILINERIKYHSLIWESRPFPYQNLMAAQRQKKSFFFIKELFILIREYLKNVVCVLGTKSNDNFLPQFQCRFFSRGCFVSVGRIWNGFIFSLALFIIRVLENQKPHHTKKKPPLDDQELC